MYFARWLNYTRHNLFLFIFCCYYKNIELMIVNQCDNDVNLAIANFEKCLQGKHSQEFETLKNAIKMLNMETLEHKMEIMESLRAKEIALKDKEIQIKSKEIQIQAKEAQIKNLENEIESLKIKYKEEINKPQLSSNEKENGNPNSGKENEVLKMNENVAGKNIPIKPVVKNEQVEIVSIKLVKDFRESIATQLNNLLGYGITKFFSGDLQASYKEWVDAIFGIMSKDSPVITEKFVLGKVKCKDSSKEYEVFSYVQNEYLDQEAQFNIYRKGWKHENTNVFIIHPTVINPMKMKEGIRQSNYHQWSVNTIPQEYIGEDLSLIHI